MNEYESITAFGPLVLQCIAVCCRSSVRCYGVLLAGAEYMNVHESINAFGLRPLVFVQCVALCLCVTVASSWRESSISMNMDESKCLAPL